MLIEGLNPFSFSHIGFPTKAREPNMYNLLGAWKRLLILAFSNGIIAKWKIWTQVTDLVFLGDRYYISTVFGDFQWKSLDVFSFFFKIHSWEI